MIKSAHIVSVAAIGFLWVATALCWVEMTALSKARKGLELATASHKTLRSKADALSLERAKDESEAQSKQALLARLTKLYEPRKSAKPLADSLAQGAILENRNAEGEQLRDESITQLFGEQYGIIYRILKWDERRIGFFEKTFSAHLQRSWAIGQCAQRSRLAANSLAVVAMVGESAALFRTDLQKLIGEQEYKRFCEVWRAQPVGSMVNELAGELCLAGTPLSEDQATGLYLTLGEASAAYKSGKVAGTADIDWAWVLDRAGSKLSSEQFQQLRERAVISRQTNDLLAQFHSKERELKAPTERKTINQGLTATPSIQSRPLR